MPAAEERPPVPTAPPDASEASASVTWEVPATAEQVSRLRRRATDWLVARRVAEAVVADVRLAVAEALSNAALHAFTTAAAGTVSLSLRLDPTARTLVVGVRDDGAGLRARADSPGLGLGLSLMSRLAQDVDIAEAADGTRGTAVVLTFSLGPAADV